MPKHIFATLIQKIEIDIRSEFEPNSRYRTVREISKRFHVSQQTAQRAVAELVERGLLVTRERSGIRVAEADREPSFAGMKVLVVSANPDPRFNHAFLDGIQTACEEVGLGASFVSTRGENTGSLAFGERLAQEYTAQNAAGIIALAFRNADLAFYHLLSKDLLILSDVDSHGLPMLPSLQSDNRRHAAEAARMMAERGKKNILIVGYWPPGNSRHQSFEETFHRLVPDAQCKYVHLADHMAIADLYLFFHRFSPTDAVFAVDYSANHTVAPYFLSQNVSPDGNLLVYDTEYETFSFNGLPPIRAAAPSLYQLGIHLAQKMITRLRTGQWPEPLRERI